MKNNKFFFGVVVVVVVLSAFFVFFFGFKVVRAQFGTAVLPAVTEHISRVNEPVPLAKVVLKEVGPEVQAVNTSVVTEGLVTSDVIHVDRAVVLNVERQTNVKTSVPTVSVHVWEV